MATPPKPLTIGIPIYPGVDLLDIAGAHEIFFWTGLVRPERTTEVLLLAGNGKAVVTSSGVSLVPGTTFARCPALDVLFVPGGNSEGVAAAMKDGTYVAFLKARSEGASLVSSVCVGALLLATAGLLDGYRATTHWAAKPALELFPNVTVAYGYPRYVVDRNRVTGGGISSGLDQALEMAAMTTTKTIARHVQLTIQYHPQPPFDDGDPAVAEPRIAKAAERSARTGFTAELVEAVRGVLGR